ncbi:histidine kinase [Oscillatoriales cyanobacterium USR001]|nr:histidine kinase [Oscillatoriales cyanobacterium USR001]
MGEQERDMNFEEQIISLDRVLQVLREEENVEVLLETILSYLQNLFDYRVIWIGLYDRVDHRLFGKGGIAPGDNSLLKQRFTLNPGDLLEQVVIQLQPVSVADLREEARAGEWRKAAVTLNIQGTTIFPLRYKDRCYGVVLLGAEACGAFPKAQEKAVMNLVFAELATTLHQIEVDWQRQQTRRPEEPLLMLISELGKIRSLDQCLQAIVEQTHQFIDPARTNVYWFERERRYFWRRVSNRQVAPGLTAGNRPASGITVQDLGGFYQALVNEQIVWIGESHSSLRSQVTGRLMKQIRARSLLAAPIVLEKELLGFLAVEANEPRIWQEDEKSYLRGAAQLVALTAPLSEMEDQMRQVEVDRELTTGVAHAIYSVADWLKTLKVTSEKLCDRLNAEHFLLVRRDPDRGYFEILWQNQLPHRRKLTSPLKAVNVSEIQLLEESEVAIAIENWEEDKRLATWRDSLGDLGVRSLLVCSTGKKAGFEPEREPENEGELSTILMQDSTIKHKNSAKGLVVIGHNAARTWNRSERELIAIASQQLGLSLHQWELQQEIQSQHKFYQTLESGLAILQQAHSSQGQHQLSEGKLIPGENLILQQLEHNFTQHIAESVGCPLVALLTWIPGVGECRISASAVASPLFALNADVEIAKTDFLIQQTLKADGLLYLNMSDLPLPTKRWLRSPGIGKIMAIALRTAPEYEPTGIVLAADSQSSRWPEMSLDLLSVLSAQLAWSRRYLTVQTILELRREELEWLNWYKQRRLEELYRTVGTGIKQLGELSQSVPGLKGEQKDTLTTLRYQQLLRQIGNALASTNILLKQEQWQLRNTIEIISAANLIRRSLERVDSLVKQFQIQLQVYRENKDSQPSGQVLSIRGDSIKLELVVYELLLIACHRSGSGGKIEIRCKPLDEKWLELAILDNGKIDPQLIIDFNNGAPLDILVPSTLDKPPGQHLIICQRVVQQMEGNLSIEQLDDGMIVSRLVLPLGSDLNPGKE